MIIEVLYPTFLYNPLYPEKVIYNYEDKKPKDYKFCHVSTYLNGVPTLFHEVENQIVYILKGSTHRGAVIQLTK